MRKHPEALALLLASILGGLTALALPAQGGRRDRRGPPPASDKEAGRFETGTFESQSLGREVRFGVHLPPGYGEDEERRYPVIYWLHGMFEDHARFHQRGGGAVMADLYKARKLPPVLIACVDGGRTSFYCNGIESGAYEDLVVKDFIPFVEKTYRALGTRAGRAIAGTSMGGNGALKIAFRYPRLFCGVATHSAALFPVDLEKLSPRFRQTLESQFGEQFKRIWGDPVDVELWAMDNPLALATKLKPKAVEEVGIYMDCGQEDRYGFQAPGRELHEILDRQKIPHEWHELPGTHGWDYLGTYLERSLTFLAARFAAGEAGNGSRPEGAASKPAGQAPRR